MRILACIGFAILIAAVLGFAIWANIRNRRATKTMTEDERAADRARWDRIPGDW